MSKLTFSIDVADIQLLRVVRRSDNVVIEVPIEETDSIIRFFQDDHHKVVAGLIHHLQAALKPLRGEDQPIRVEFVIPDPDDY